MSVVSVERPAPSLTPLAGHIRHALRKNIRVGSFAGKRLSTEIVRCRSCGGVLLSVDQVEVRSGRRG
jgi:hypothetical protein